MPSGEALRLIGGRGTLATAKPVQSVESYLPYATTLFDYIRRAMPFHAPGSLSNDEVYAVSAYILGEAKIIARTEVMSAQTLPLVKMPNRDGFIPDTRPEHFKPKKYSVGNLAERYGDAKRSGVYRVNSPRVPILAAREAGADLRECDVADVEAEFGRAFRQLSGQSRGRPSILLVRDVTHFYHGDQAKATQLARRLQASWGDSTPARTHASWCSWIH